LFIMYKNVHVVTNQKPLFKNVRAQISLCFSPFLYLLWYLWPLLGLYTLHCCVCVSNVRSARNKTTQTHLGDEIIMLLFYLQCQNIIRFTVAMAVDKQRACSPHLLIQNTGYFYIYYVTAAHNLQG